MSGRAENYCLRSRLSWRLISLQAALLVTLVVILMGGLLAVISALRAGAVRSTVLRVLQILVGLLPGWQMPKFAVPADKRLTIPYGVAITLGSIITLAVFRV